MAMTMPELGIHQGDDGFEDFQSRPPSHEGEIDSDEEERSMEPQAEEDVRNSDGLRNRKMKSSRPEAEEDVRYPDELGNGKEKSSRSGSETWLTAWLTTKRDLLPVSIDKLLFHGFEEVLGATFAWDGIRLVLALLVVLCSRSFSGELYVDQHEDSKDLHQKISEMRIVETPLHSIRSVAHNGKWVFKLARHDFLLLRTAGDKWYKAEKHGPNSGQAGIHFYPVTGPGAETIRFRSNISVDFSLAQARDTLTDHELAYSLWGENCWKYAHSRAEAILNSCIEKASDDNVRNGLKKELEDLMDARRRMPNEVVDIAQRRNILWGVLFCLMFVYGRFWLGFRNDLERRPSFFFKLCAVHSMSFVFDVMRDPNPILLTYDLTKLGTTYRWHFNFLSFFGYFVGWTVFTRGVDSWILELEKPSEDPCPRTAVSGREDLDVTTVGANHHEDASMEDHREERPSRAQFFGFVILDFVMTFDQMLGYNIGTQCLRYFFVGGCLLATKSFFRSWA